MTGKVSSFKVLPAVFVLGVVTGIAVLAAFSSAPGKANVDSSGCQIVFGQHRLTNAPRCLDGEVVTGIMTTSYYCARPAIVCSPDQNHLPAENP